MNYIFDTSTIITYLRNDDIRELIEDALSPFSIENIAIVSVVSMGELESMMLRNSWGERKQKRLFDLLEQMTVTDINSKSVIETYGEIDVFSQNRLPNKPLGTSARNMGKNDLWIAATASVTNSTLISADKDFLHLKGEYIDLIFIDIQTKTIS